MIVPNLFPLILGYPTPGVHFHLVNQTCRYLASQGVIKIHADLGLIKGRLKPLQIP
jgi:hypothetical protein